jgi:pilus assembly protein FimV
LAGLVAPLCAFALGVGPLEVRSALNQSFEAEIPLIVNNPAELTGLTVRIPRQQDFDQLGVERLEFLSKLRFSVQAPPGGPSVVKITSIEPIREPNFNLLLEVTWPRGRLLRDFPVQLDPELYASRRQPAPPPAPVVAPPPVAAMPAAPSAAASTLPPAPSVSFEGASLYGPVRPGETLLAIANRVRPSTAISLPRMMAILVAGNPEAFINGNPDALRAGSTLKVPTQQALGVQGAPGLAAVPAPELAAAPVPAPVEPVFPPAATAPVAPAPSMPLTPAVPSPVETTPPATEMRPVLPPSLAEQPREIVPQASIPQTPPTSAAPPEAVTPPAAQPPAAAPEAVTPAPAAPLPPSKPPAPPVEAASSWLSNPVVWIAVMLIILAVAAMVLLPLIRRPARPKPVVEEEAAVVKTPKPTSEIPITRVQFRRRPEAPAPAKAAGTTVATDSTKAAPAASPRAAEPTPKPALKPVIVPPPKPIDELLKDIDFGLGEGRPPAAAGGKGAAAAPGPEMRLPDAEPSTAPVVRGPSILEPAKPPQRMPPPPPKTTPPPSPQVELPPELRLDKQDFNFGDLEFETTARPVNELPPLEMKPSATGPAEPPPLEPGVSSGLPTRAVPPPEPKSKPAMPKASDLKFEFADVTQEFGKAGAREDLKLDRELESFGGDTLGLGKMEVGLPGGGEMGADYVETKLDLAAAYLDMGDQVGARGLLEEALREGDASQKKRAGELLKKLG